jgi:hypothetical protein
MDFKINNTDLLTAPTNHGWVTRTRLGYDGNGHPVYATPRQYQLKYDWLDAASFAQLIGFYQMCTGTIPVNLPMWDSASGGFASYNGTLEEPSYGSSFEGAYGAVSFLILNIK